MLTKISMIFLFVLSAVFVSGCTTARKAALSAAVPLLQEQTLQSKARTNPKTAEILSLQEAVKRALESNPDLKVFKTEVKAREARTFQENLLPNPGLMVEFGNMAGSGPYGGLKSAEATIGIGQLIELGGKRSKRVEIAALQSDLALWQYEIKRLEIVTRVRSLFLRVLTAQKKLNLDRKRIKLARTFKSNVDILVRGGRLSTAETVRAQVELSKRELDLRQTLREFNTAARLLSAMWGTDTVSFKQVDGVLQNSVAIPSANRLRQALKESPLLIRQNTVIKRRQVKIALADAQAIPDPMFTIAYRRFNENGAQALVAGLGIPIPIFDRNQGGREEARYRAQQSEQQLQSLQTRMGTEINNRLEIVNSLTSEIKTIRDIIIPQAQKAYGIIMQNYRLGKYSLIDVLDAQRQLFNAEERYLEALAGVNSQVIELEGLLGRSLESL